jgi:hypothetical protein
MNVTNGEGIAVTFERAIYLRRPRKSTNYQCSTCMLLITPEEGKSGKKNFTAFDFRIKHALLSGIQITFPNF